MVSHFQIFEFHRLCKSADKLYTQALTHEDIYDEEKAYIFYMRYMTIFDKIRKSNQYKKDKVSNELLWRESVYFL